MIDTGCSKSIIRPDIIQKYYPDKIYHNEIKLKTCTGQTTIRFQANIPAFTDFAINETMNVLLYDFHEFFDGLIGFEDLQKLHLTIDPANNCIQNAYVSIPLLMRSYNNITKTYSIDTKEVILKKIPVNAPDGDIFIPSITDDKCVIPDIITTCHEGQALVEIHNISDEPTQVNFIDPITAYDLNAYYCYSPKLNNISTESIRKDQIPNLIRTDHLNEEEKSEITKLYQEYHDVFFPRR